MITVSKSHYNGVRVFETFNIAKHKRYSRLPLAELRVGVLLSLQRFDKVIIDDLQTIYKNFPEELSAKFSVEANKLHDEMAIVMETWDYIVTAKTDDKK